MASPTLAYNRTAGSTSIKSRPAPPFNLAEQVNGSTLPQRLRTTLAAMLVFDKFGQELWCSTFAVRIQAGVSYRTVQRHIDKLIAMKVLRQVYSANSMVRHRGRVEFRRTATYELNVGALGPRITYRQWRDRQPVSVPFKPRSAKPAVSTAAEPEIVQSQTSAPQRPARKVPSLTVRQRRELVRRIQFFTQGFHGSVQCRDGSMRYVSPQDPDYRAPMDKSAAILEACKSMCESEGVSLERAIEAAADAGFKIEPKGDA